MTPHADDTSFAERRQYPRIVLKAYAQGCSCRFSVAGGAASTAQLVDISPGGARLRAEAEPPTEKADLALDCGFLKDASLPTPLLGKVRWTNQREFGVAFDPMLPLSTSDLQRMIDS